MKKSLLALAALGAFAGVASAQSSITIYGLVDANVGKDIGLDDKRVGQGAQSRLGFRGVEDLGNGLRATFNFQHRFDSGTGAAQGTGNSVPGQVTTSPFWQAEANVGLAGNFGNLRIGRQYTEAFYQQISADPFGYDTVANLKTFTEGGIATTRVNNSVSYWITQSGVTFGLQIAEANDNGPTPAGAPTTTNPQPQPIAGTVGQKRPVNARLQYAAGPIFVGLSYENPSDQDDNWTFVNGSYNLGVAKIGAFYGTGTNNAALDRKSYGLTATAPFGTGEARIAYAQFKGKGTATGPELNLRKQASVGYHYSLSKRTTIYGDFAKASREGGPLVAASANPGTNGKASDTGYDFGVKHVF